MKITNAIALAFFAFAPVAAHAQDETDAAAGVCDMNAVAFSQQVFNKQANANAKCQELSARTGQAADCAVKKLNNGKFLAQFVKQFQLKQLNLAGLFAALQGLLAQNKILSDNQIKVQMQVTNGCG